MKQAASRPRDFANRLWLTGVMTLGLSACYSDGSSYIVPPPPAYSIAGTITGLSAAGLVLQNEGGDSLAVSANSSSFRFATQVAAGGVYNVTVSAQPTGLTCTVSHGSGDNVAAPVTNVSVACNPVSYTLAGTVTGLTADGLVLQNNGGDNLLVNTNAATFQFSTPVAAGGGYSVATLTQPAGLICTVSHGSGTNVRADVTNVSVTCSASTFTVGGTVTGLTASGLVLQDNGGDNLIVAAGASSFVFATPVAYGSSYAATVFAQPAGQSCSVSNATGPVKADVTGVTVACSTIMTYTLTAGSGANGSIAPAGPVSVNGGGSQGFVAIPNASYVVNQWLLDGAVAQSGGATFTLGNVTANHTVNVTFAQAALSPSVSFLALAANGNARQISITNTGTVVAANVSVASSGLPSGTTISSSNCTATLATGNSCSITVTPGANSTSNCTTGGAATPGTITVSSADASPSTVNVAVLSYGCIYQGGYLYSLDDTTATTMSIGGKVAALFDQSAGIIWSSDSTGSYDGGVSIWGIAQTSTSSSPSPTSTPYAGQTSCNGATDGACDSNNINVYYYNVASPPVTILAYYAAALCDQLISGYSDWYLPSICELGYDAGGNGSGCGTAGAPTLQNMQSNLVDTGTVNLVGVHWSSTEMSGDPLSYAWIQYFATAGGSLQLHGIKSMALSVRCSRALSP
jgi:hypothetical protein